MEVAFRVNAPAVVGEVIDGEAVIMDLSTGRYFSISGSGAEIWRGIEVGLGRSALGERLAERYAGDPAEMAGALEGFLSELLSQRLIVEGPPNADLLPAVTGGAPTERFVTPVLNAYSDMEELLLLDPIHDVDDQIGWPAARPVEPNA